VLEARLAAHVKQMADNEAAQAEAEEKSGSKRKSSGRRKSGGGGSSSSSDKPSEPAKPAGRKNKLGLGSGDDPLGGI